MQNLRGSAAGSRFVWKETWDIRPIGAQENSQQPTRTLRPLLREKVSRIWVVCRIVASRQMKHDLVTVLL